MFDLCSEVPTRRMELIQSSYSRLTIWPCSFQRATVQKSTWKLFFVGWITVAPGIDIGPVIVPVKSATVHVHSHWASMILYGLLMRCWSGKVLKNAIASCSWASMPCVGG